MNSSSAALELFKALLATSSPTGYENGIASIVRTTLEAWGYSHETDGSGNVLVRLAGQRSDAPLCCLAAHIDEIGMVVTRIDPAGSLEVTRSGGLYPWKLGESPVDILGDTDTVTGVLSMGSTHTAGSGDRVIRWSDVKIITGLSPDQLTARGVRPGTPVMPKREICGPILFGDPSDPLVGAWTLDDRVGVVALLRMLESVHKEQIVPHSPMLIAFTVHEEGGGHGAKALAQRERPQIFIAVDGCPIPVGSPLKLSGDPALWVKDRIAVYDPRLVRIFGEAAQRAGSITQHAVFDYAASDASLVYAAGGAERIAAIGHVRENSHGYEVARLSAFDNLHHTLVEFLRIDLQQAIN